MKILVYIILVLFFVFIGFLLYLKTTYKPILKEKIYRLCKIGNSTLVDDEIKLLSWNIHKENYKKEFQSELNKITNCPVSPHYGHPVQEVKVIA